MRRFVRNPWKILVAAALVDVVSVQGSMYVRGAYPLTMSPHEMYFPTNDAEKTIMTLTVRFDRCQQHIIGSTVNYLKIGCDGHELCIGSVFPSLSFYQADSYAEISLAINRIPTAVFLNSGRFLRVTSYLLLNIKTTDLYTYT